jgi:hypothetical protein
MAVQMQFETKFKNGKFRFLKKIRWAIFYWHLNCLQRTSYKNNFFINFAFFFAFILNSVSRMPVRVVDYLFWKESAMIIKINISWGFIVQRFEWLENSIRHVGNLLFFSGFQQKIKFIENDNHILHESAPLRAIELNYNSTVRIREMCPWVDSIKMLKNCMRKLLSAVTTIYWTVSAIFPVAYFFYLLNFAFT